MNPSNQTRKRTNHVHSKSSSSSSSSSTRKSKLAKNEKEEKRLTALLFGNNSFISNKSSSSSAWHDEADYDDDDEEEDNDEEYPGEASTEYTNESLFQIDRHGGRHDDDDDDDDDDDGDEKNLSDHENRGEWNNQDLEEEDSQSQGEEEEEEEETRKKENSTTVQQQQQAWIDEDDPQVSISLVSTSVRLRKLRSSMSEDVIDGNQYQQRLRDRFQSTTTTSTTTQSSSWAKIRQEDFSLTTPSSSSILPPKRDQSYDNVPTVSSILSSTKPLISSISTFLPPNIFHVIRRPDINLSDPNQSVIQAVQFHPMSDEDTPLLFTAGLDKTLRFFRVVDDKTSDKIHGIHFPNLPIYSASFLGDSGNVLVSGRRKFFYIYDTITGHIEKIPSICGREEKSLEKHVVSPDGTIIAFIGNDGFIILVEASSKQWIGDLKMNGSCRALCFSPDGKEIFSSGSDGDVYRWDLRNKRCIDKFSNDDGMITSTLSMSSNYLAVGSESGVVNLYDNKVLEERSYSKRSPVKQIMNLKTSVDFMKFNSNGEILAMSSRREKDSLKLLHTKSKTIFSNWPTSKTPLGYAWSLDFSPGSKFMAIGNDKGKCLLYKLNHYHEC